MKKLLQKYLTRLLAQRGYLLTPHYKLMNSNIYLVERLKKIIKQYSIDCIIDAGANIGQYGRFLREEVGYDKLIVSFEPDPTTYSQLRANMGNDALWIAYNQALGDENGELTFNIMKNSLLNSFLEPHDGDTKLLATVNVIKDKIAVPVRRLDAMIDELKRNHSFGNVYLKMDTQGYDIRVFRGASGRLSSIFGIQTEASVLPIYKDMPTFSDSLQIFRDSGYEVSGIYPVEEDRFPHAVEFDCIYLKK